jgi:hypothetical protein
MVAKVDALVWNAAKGGSNGACSVLDARSAFGPKFVNYLARFLLAYDTPTRRLWRARAAEIPLRWSAKQIAEARRAQLGEFIGSVERSLCDYTPTAGVWSEPLAPKDATRIRQVLSLLRSRYGSKPDALRQLALLFSLLPRGIQPTSSIEQLAAEQENREASSIIVIDGGSFVLSEKGRTEGLPAPALPLPAGPRRRTSDAAVAGQPRLRPTGRVLSMVVLSGGSGYDSSKPPAVSVTAPFSRSSSSQSGADDVRRGDRATMQSEPWRKGRRAAQARAIVQGGRVVALELVDQGAGYRETDRVRVLIAPPPQTSLVGKAAATGAGVARVGATGACLRPSQGARVGIRCLAGT